MQRYQRNRKPNWPLLILIGALAGAIFVVLDNPDTLFVGSATDTPSTARVETLPAPEPSPNNAQVATPNTPPPQLLIPAAAVSAPIIPVFLDGVSWDVSRLGSSIGHLQGTAWLDEPGNIVLSGHVELSDGRRGVFASLTTLKAGDRVIVQYQGEERQYTISSIYTVPPEDLTPIYPTNEDQLTLITCDDYNFLSDSYETRTIVVAQRVTS